MSLVARLLDSPLLTLTKLMSDDRTNQGWVFPGKTGFGQGSVKLNYFRILIVILLVIIIIIIYLICNHQNSDRIKVQYLQNMLILFDSTQQLLC